MYISADKVSAYNIGARVIVCEEGDNHHDLNGIVLDDSGNVVGIIQHVNYHFSIESGSIPPPFSELAEQSGQEDVEHIKKWWPGQYSDAQLNRYAQRFDAIQLSTGKGLLALVLRPLSPLLKELTIEEVEQRSGGYEEHLDYKEYLPFSAEMFHKAKEVREELTATRSTEITDITPNAGQGRHK